MKEFVSKPVHIEAVVFDGAPDADIERWLGDAFETWLPSTRQLVFHIEKSGNAEVTINPGDAIIKERDGQGFYPCRGQEFWERYEPMCQHVVARADCVWCRAEVEEGG